jgi:hypothetical protein
MSQWQCPLNKNSLLNTEDIMKKFIKVLGSMLSILAVFYFANPCFAQERATKEECVAKVEEKLQNWLRK